MKSYLFIHLLLILFGIFSCQSRQQAVPAQNTAQSGDSLTLTDPLIELPRIIEKPCIEFSIDAPPMEQKVVVYVKATIDTVGKISDVRVVRSVNALFDEKAIELAQKYKFAPGKIDRKLSAMTISWAIEFSPAKE